MTKIYMPSTGPEAWQRLLADPDKHWRTRFSAKALAHCWESANKALKNKGLPVEIASMLKAHGDNPELLIAIPEHKVSLPGASRGESQSDLFLLARVGDRTFAITVEGKVNEPFGKTLSEWLVDASNGKLKRIAFICDVLGLSFPLRDSDQIRYQLLHRAASAVIEAKRFKTDAAAMIVHSFSETRLWFESFVQFAQLFDARVEPNQLIAVRAGARPPLYVGWACGDCEFLNV